VPGQEEIPFGKPTAPPRTAPPRVPPQTAKPPTPAARQIAGPDQRVHTTGAPPAVAEGENRDTLAAEAARNGDTVFVCIGKTINTGNYESVRLDIGRCRALKDGEDFETVQTELVGEIAAKVQELEAEILEATGANQQQ
jgi:hypothetical protein